MESTPVRRAKWVVISKKPPAVLLDGEIWLICPVRGFDCGRVPRDPFGAEWALDVIAVHVHLHHTRWN